MLMMDRCDAIGSRRAYFAASSCCNDPPSQRLVAHIIKVMLSSYFCFCCCCCCRGYTRKEPFANTILGLNWSPRAENWNGRWVLH
jgi:hypothetical protein